MEKRKVLAVVLTLCMLLSLMVMPVTANAASSGKFAVTGYVAPDVVYSPSVDSIMKAGFKVEAVGAGLSVFTDSKGYFELEVSQNTNTTITISKQGYLVREAKNVMVNGNVELGSGKSPVLMWAGDMPENGAQDNAVNMMDIMTIARYFNVLKGNSNYNEIYDLNRDDAINMTDIMIAAKNFNKTPADYPAVEINTTTPPPTTTPPTTPPTHHGQADFSLIGFASMNGGTNGGTGGKVVTASSASELTTIMSNKRKDTTPLIVKITGKITGTGAIPVKEVQNLTIIGEGTKGEMEGIGLNVQKSSNVIIRNLKIHHVKADADCIGIEDSKNVWVDHCELYNMKGDCNGDGVIDTEGDIAGGDVDWYDGLLDAKKSAEYITVSWNYFHDSFKTSLVGSSDGDNFDRKMTFHHNIYSNVNSRTPSYRFGTGHMFNNYYVDIDGSGINSRMGAKLRIENNIFENVGGGTIDEKLGFAEGPIGAYYSSAKGFWDVKDNQFINCKGNQPTESTCEFIPPYDYSKLLHSVNSVKAIVTQYAGIGKIDPDVPVPTGTNPGNTPTTPPTATIKPTPTKPPVIMMPTPTQDPGRPVPAYMPSDPEKAKLYKEYIDKELGNMVVGTGGNGGNKTITQTILVRSGTTYDGRGEVITAVGMGDGSGAEHQKPFFVLEPGANLKNVTLTAPGVEGVHMFGDNVLENVVWEDVGEDAASVRSYFKGGKISILNCKAYNAEDKMFQFNTPCEVIIKDFVGNKMGKLVRQNGGEDFPLSIYLENVVANGFTSNIVVSDSPQCTLTYKNLTSDGKREKWFKGPMKIICLDGSSTTPPPTQKPTASPTQKPTTQPTAVPTQTPNSGGTKTITETIVVKAGQTHDGKGERIICQGMGKGDQSENQKPVFKLEKGAKLKNVRLAFPACDGVHCYGDNVVENVVWEDIGEDALTVKDSGTVEIIGGSARDGEDKCFQINAASTFKVTGFAATNVGKLIRQNGGTTFKVTIYLDNVKVDKAKECIARTDSSSTELYYKNCTFTNVPKLWVFPSTSQVHAQ